MLIKGTIDAPTKSGYYYVLDLYQADSEVWIAYIELALVPDIGVFIAGVARPYYWERGRFIRSLEPIELPEF